MKLALILGTLFVALTHLFAPSLAVPWPQSNQWAAPNVRRIALIPIVSLQGPDTAAQCPNAADSPLAASAPGAGSLRHATFGELRKTVAAPPSSRFCWRGATDGQIAWTAAPMP
jgi:hypothetical protein